MASYPTSVKTFTTKNPGDKIASADVNDLQAEVNAIEAGLLNGTANLNSSASTLASLSVTGGSTLTGDVVMAGTLSATARAKVSVTHTGTQGVANAVQTGLSWDTTSVDPAGMHSTSVNSSRLTFRASAGWYLVGCSVRWEDVSTGGVRDAFIYLNDVTRVLGDEKDNPVAANKFHSVSGMVQVTSTTDYVTVQMLHTTGSTGSVSSGPITSFWAVRI
jgi:hypothetical protein